MRNVYVEKMEKEAQSEEMRWKILKVVSTAVYILWALIKFAIMVCIIVLLAGAISSHAEEQPIAIIYQDPEQAQAHAITIDEAPPINRISEDLDEQDANGHRMEYLGEFRLTYYCPCAKCNGNSKAIDRMGNPLVWGTVAVDPKVIPLGTQLVVDGYDAIFTARDTGGKWVQGNHIDIFVPVPHSEALAMCKDQWVKVWRWVE